MKELEEQIHEETKKERIKEFKEAYKDERVRIAREKGIKKAREHALGGRGLRGKLVKWAKNARSPADLLGINDFVKPKKKDEER